MRGGQSDGDTAVARAPLPWLAVAFVPVALVVLAGGGSDSVRLAWVALAALAALAVLGVAVMRGSLAPARPGPEALLLVGALAALVAWQGLSLLWSIEGDRTWQVFNRGLAYLAFLALGWLAAAAAGSVRAPAAALAALLGTVVVWALLGAVIPALGPDTDRSARLQEPVQYWNGLALLLAVSLPLWLWLAARRDHVPRVRAGATAMLFLALVALALTTSRGGVLAALAALGVWLAVARPRLESVGALALAGIPAVAVAAWALLGSVIADAGPLDGERRTDGAVLGVLLVLGAAGVVVAALRLARLAPADPVRRRIGRALLLGGAVAAVIAVVAVLVAVDVGQAWDDFRNPPAVQVTTGAGRVTEVSSNHRWTWWTQAWELFRDEPWGGWGAGAFELARRPIRQDSVAPLDPHNLPLAALAETGVVGFALLLAAIAGGVWVAAAGVARLRDDERAAAVALAAGAAAWLVHSLVDMPWQYAATTAPVLFGLGALAAAGRPAVDRRAGRPGLATMAVAAGLLAVAVSVASPAVAERESDAAFESLLDGDATGAVDGAKRARTLDPLAIEPVIVQGTAEEIRGNLDEAERLFRHAVELQPRNPRGWYELGRFEFESRRRLEPAFVYADRSYALDRRTQATGELLDAIRAAMEARLDDD